MRRENQLECSSNIDDEGADKAIGAGRTVSLNTTFMQQQAWLVIRGNVSLIIYLDVVPRLSPRHSDNPL